MNHFVRKIILYFSVNCLLAMLLSFIYIGTADAAKPYQGVGGQNCPEDRVLEYQPVRYQMIDGFVQAASNNLGISAPAYFEIAEGISRSNYPSSIAG